MTEIMQLFVNQITMHGNVNSKKGMTIMYIQKACKYCVRYYNYKVSVNTQLEQESCKLLVQKHLVAKSE